MEWITGVKLTTLPPNEVRSLVKIGQEAFLTQLLEIGFFHGDPHPGNLLKVRDWLRCRDRRHVLGLPAEWGAAGYMSLGMALYQVIVATFERAARQMAVTLGHLLVQ